MQIENTSGQGPSATIPPEIDRWNWGAFLLNWIWGIGNNTPIALLMFVPFVNFVMVFMLGAKGSIWAWRNKRWDSIEHFQAVQRQWAKWAIILYALVAALTVAACIAFFFVVSSMLRDSEAYKLAVTQLTQNTAVIAALGQPLVTGTPSGNFKISNLDGNANLQFSVEGSSGKGTAHVQAKMELGRWRIEHMLLDESSGRRIEIK